MRSSWTDIRVEPLEGQEWSGFSRYIGRAFHSKYILADRSFHEWQYENGFYAAKSGSEIVGHFGFRDIAYKIFDQVRSVRVLMNLFVLPEYRTLGVGTLLAETVLDNKKSTLVSGYTQATDRLIRHFKKNWREAGNLKRFFIVQNDDHPIFKGFPANPRSPRPHYKNLWPVQNGIKFDKRFDDLWKNLSDQFPVTLKRSSGYLKWRFGDHPFFNYQFLIAEKQNELAGYLVFHLEEDQGFQIARIVDLFAHKKTAPELLEAFLNHLKASAIPAADFFTSSDYYDDVFEPLGFFDTDGTAWERFPILFSPISTKKLFINIGYDFGADFKNCYFTKAEGDQDRPNSH